jgi:hypothetical protein
MRVKPRTCEHFDADDDVAAFFSVFVIESFAIIGLKSMSKKVMMQKSL